MGHSRLPLGWRVSYLRTVAPHAVVSEWDGSRWHSTDSDEWHGDPRVAFQVLPNSAASPVRFPYGGPWPNTPDSLSAMTELKQITGLADFSLVMCPDEFLDPDTPNSPADVTIDVHDPTFVIDLSTWTEDILSRGNKKCLKRSRELMTFRNLGHSRLEDVYRLLVRNRKALGGTMSVTRSEVRDQIRIHPWAYRLYGIETDQAGLIAAAICVAILPKVTYVLAWGDEPKARKPLSPVVQLCCGIAAEEQSLGNRYLDLGRSSARGAVLEGLARFKRNLGAQEMAVRRSHVA